MRKIQLKILIVCSMERFLTDTTAIFIHSEPISMDITATALAEAAKASSTKAVRPAAFIGLVVQSIPTGSIQMSFVRKAWFFCKCNTSLCL